MRCPTVPITAAITMTDSNLQIIPESLSYRPSLSEVDVVPVSGGWVSGGLSMTLPDLSVQMIWQGIHCPSSPRAPCDPAGPVSPRAPCDPAGPVSPRAPCDPA